MPKVALKQLAADVATLLGEALSLECHPEESPFPDIEDRVRTIAPGILSDLILSSPLDSLSDWKSFSGSFKMDDNGVVTFSLPDDFLRLVSIRMSDWQTPVSLIIPMDSDKGKCQKSIWNGIRGTPSRPVVMEDFSSTGQRCLKLFTSGKNATLEIFLYMTRPVIDSSDSIEIPDRLYHSLLSQILRHFSS